MTQKIQLPNGDTLEFPDDMADDAIAKAITSNYPEFAPKAAPRTLAGLPVRDPDAPAPAPSERPRVLAGMRVKDAPLLDDAAPAADSYEPGTEQNQFAAGRMSRTDYEREFRALNPRAQQGAIDAALATYDQQKAAQLKAADAKRQAGPMKGVPTSDEFFNDRLNARLQGKQNGVVPQLPGHEQQDFSSTTSKHTANPDDESAASAAGSLLGRSTAAGLYDLAGAGAKILDAINPFTTSDADAAILFKNDPAKLKQMQDESVALGLGRFARAMQTNSNAQMEQVSERAKRDYGKLEYETLDPSKSAFTHPLKIVGDAVRSLPSSLAMAASAFLTRGASLRAEQSALAAGLGADAASAAGVQAAMKMMGNAGAVSEGAIGYAQQALSSADDASKIPMADLQKAPQFQSLLKQGYTPETARAKIIADIGEHAGQIGGLVDAVTNKFGGEFLGKIISEGGPFMRRVLSGAANESATEFVQSAGEQMGQNFATQQSADPNKPLMDGVGEAAIAGAAVGGLMGGVTAGAAGHHGEHIDENALAQYKAEATAAEAARRAALGNWNTNGLTPSSRPGATGRSEPTWGEATGAVPAARREPSVADIGAATSVDDAIAAATAVTAAPARMPDLPNTSPHATGAEIDALEEAAGITADHTPEEHQGAHDQLMAEMAARASEAGGNLAAETQAANLPPGGKTAEADDWHAFPPESRTLGVPRAQMPQIRAEHRGAMTQFLNARGISHEEVEVSPDTLKPTQREFSVSKVQKAIEYQGGNRAILISSDGYVLDGHHQWMAAMEKGEPIRAIRLNAPIKQLVKTVHQFPSATVDTSSAAAAPAGTARPGQSLLDENAQRIQRQDDAVRQAAERQEQHRAGQAPQEQGSSVPTAAERAPAAPMPPPKPTAGQRMRERISRENPFLGFLATHGLHISERSDTGGQKGRAGGVIVPGFGGSLYRKNGARLDELAQLAHEAGFLSDDDINDPKDTGGTRKLADMIQSAVHSKEVIRPAGLLEAAAPSSDERLQEEAQRLGIDSAGLDADTLYDKVRAAHVEEEEKQATSGATHDEQDAIDHYADQIDMRVVDAASLNDDDIPFDLTDPRLVSTAQLTEEDLDALFPGTKAAGPAAAGGETEAGTAAPAREGAGRTGTPSQKEIRARLKTIAERLGIHVNEANGGFSSGKGMVHIPAEDQQAEGAQTPEHVFAHELGHAIISKRGLNFVGIPMSHLRSKISNWDELVAASKAYRPAVWNHEREQVRKHARKPNEVIADALGSVLIGEQPLSLLAPMMDGYGINEWDMGLRERGQADGDNLLTSYTAGEVVERDAAATARAKAIEAERDKLDRQRQAEKDAKELRAKIDSTVDDFQLGQDPSNQISGQTDIFSQPAPAATAKPKQAEMERQEFDAKSGVGKISAVKERYGDKFGVSWASTNIATADTMEEAAAIARAVAESGAENITEMRRVASKAAPAAATGTTPQPDANGYIYGVQNVTGGSKSTTKRAMAEAKSWGYTEDNVPLSKRESGWMIAETFKHIEQPVVDFENGDVTFKILVAQAPNGKWAAGAHYFATGFGGSSHPPMFGHGPYNTREDAVHGGAAEIKKYLAAVPGIDAMVDGEVSKAISKPAALEQEIEKAKKGGKLAAPSPADKAFADLLATKAMADYREMDAAGKASFKAGFVDGFEGKPFPAAAVKDGAMDAGYRFGARHSRDLEQRHKMYDGAIDDLSDSDVHALHKKMGMAGEKQTAEWKREAIKAEHPDDIEAGLGTLEDANKPDTGADIPAHFYSTVTVDYAHLGADGKTVTEQLAADKALAQTREDISNLEALLKCMGHH